MRAVVCKAFGPPTLLAIEDVPRPIAVGNRVTIRVVAAGVNFRDLLSVQGRYQHTPAPPFCPGCEVAGIVISVGDKVETPRVGDRVAAFTGWGAFADEVAVDACWTVPLPAYLPMCSAAAALISYGTAYHALLDRAALRVGDTVLVLGAAGAAGIAAIEVSKAMGARVIACASTEAKLTTCLEHGADVVINYSASSFRDSIRQAAATINVIYDVVGDPYTETAVRSLAWGGQALVVGFAGGTIPRLPLNLLLLKGCSVVGVWWGEFVRRDHLAFTRQWKIICDWYRDGIVHPHVGLRFPLEDAGEALVAIESRRTIGKVVISSPDP